MLSVKNTVWLIDTNVVLDYILVRQPQFSNSTRVLLACQNDDINGYLAFHSLSSIWYVLRKNRISDRRTALLEITDFLTVIGAPHDSVIVAIKNEDFRDFEDCLQEKCALEVNADYIVTNNVKDFVASTISVVTPADILKILIKNGEA